MPDITIATSFNYRTMRVVSLLYDLMSADTSNMYGHLSVAGAQGMWLDWIGAFYQVPIFTGEDQDGYRRRVLRTLAQPKENNVAIAQLVSESFGVANVLALDYTLFRCILYVFGSLSQPTLVMPYVRSIAPAGIIWTGIEIPPGGELVGALAGHTVAGTLSDRPVATTMSDTGRSFLAMPLSGIFAILR